MTHSRIFGDRLRSLIRQFPAVTVLGARQTGKSTLAKLIFKDFDYFDLERPADLQRLQADPMFVFSQSRKIIIDEAQRFPELFPVIRSFLDENPKNKMVLLGSASPQLISQVSESLTGRAAFLELPGISILEEKKEMLWIKGGFPRIHWSKPKARSEDWYPAYLRTYLEQDIPQLGFRVSSIKMRNLLAMLAHVQGNVCNLSELGGSLGMNYHSVDLILDIFEGTFMIRRLQPYFVNIGKRLVKSPKIYIRDTGMLHSLLNLPFSKKSLFAHPKAGASFETFCIEQIFTLAQLKDPTSQIFFYRTQTGVEVDLLLKFKGKIIPIEIKLSSMVQNCNNMKICMSDLGLKKGYFVNLSSGLVEIGPKIYMCSLESLLDELDLKI